MDIAAVSMTMNAMKLQDAVGVRLMKMTMDTSQEAAVNMNSMIGENSRNSMQLDLGNNIDSKV